MHGDKVTGSRLHRFGHVVKHKDGHTRSVDDTRIYGHLELQHTVNLCFVRGSRSLPGPTKHERTPERQSSSIMRFSMAVRFNVHLVWL